MFSKYMPNINCPFKNLNNLNIYIGIGGLYFLFNTFNDSRNHLIEWKKNTKINKHKDHYNKTNLQVAKNGAYKNFIDNYFKSIMWLPDLFITFIPYIAYITTKEFWKSNDNNNDDNNDDNDNNNDDNDNNNDDDNQ